MLKQVFEKLNAGWRSTTKTLVLGVGLLAVASCGPEPISDISYSNSANRMDSRNYNKPSAALNNSQLNEGPIKIALLLPLSGNSSGTGKALLDAASLALFEAYDPRIQLMPLDTLGSVEGAKRATLDAISAEVDVILGPLFSDASFEAAKLARGAKIPMISFSNNKNIAGNGVYVLSFMPDQEVNQIVRYANEQGLKRFAALIPEGAYGEIILNSLSQAVAQWGGEITALELYSANAEEVTQPVRRLANYEVRRRAYVREERFLENLGGGMAEDVLKDMENLETIGEVSFDAVLIPEGGELLRTLAPLLPFFEVDPAKVKFLGTGLWDDRSLVHEPPLKGGWYASSSPEATDAFYTQFNAVFHYQPSRIATLAYDAMSLITVLARKEISAQRFSEETFLNPNGFTGVDGLFRFSNRGVSERKLAVVEIQPSGFRTIKDVPNSFEN